MRAVIVAALVASTAGCARRPTPYQFRAPVLAGVRAAEIPARAPPIARRELPRRRPPVARVRRPRPAAPIPLLEPVPESPTVQALHGLVGERAETSDLSFALRALGTVGLTVDPAVGSAADGSALMSLAQERGAVSEGPPLLGDLVVFDAVVGADPASLVGVVVSGRDDGTAEFVYLAGGVVRRGWVNPEHSSEQRDRRGRILNTFVRHSDCRDKRGTRYLAGELLAAFLRLDRLAPR